MCLRVLDGLLELLLIVPSRLPVLKLVFPGRDGGLQLLFLLLPRILLILKVIGQLLPGYIQISQILLLVFECGLGLLQFANELLHLSLFSCPDVLLLLQAIFLRGQCVGLRPQSGQISLLATQLFALSLPGFEKLPICGLKLMKLLAALVMQSIVFSESEFRPLKVIRHSLQLSLQLVNVGIIFRYH